MFGKRSKELKHCIESVITKSLKFDVDISKGLFVKFNSFGVNVIGAHFPHMFLKFGFSINIYGEGVKINSSTFLFNEGTEMGMNFLVFLE